MHRVQIQRNHILKELCARWGRSDGDTDWGWEAGCISVCAQESVDCGRGSEVRDSFREKKVPDVWVGEPPEGVVRAADRNYGPVDGPAGGVEEWQGAEVFCALVGENGLYVEIGLDDVAEAGEICPSVSVFDAFGFGCSLSRPHTRNHISTYTTHLIHAVGSARKGISPHSYTPTPTVHPHSPAPAAGPPTPGPPRH